MGWFSDLLGGKKAPGAPKELQELARGAQGIANQLRDSFSQLRGDFERIGPEYERRLTAQQGDLGVARRGYLSRAGEDADLYDEYGLPLQREVFDEAMAAGSNERMALEDRLAREAASREISRAGDSRQNELSRLGLRTTGGALGDIQKGAALGAIGNQARLAERRYGEASRRGLFGAARGIGDSALMNLGRAADASGAIAGAEFGKAKGYGDLNLMLTRSGSGAGAEHSRASDLFGDYYNAQITKHNADQQRHANILGNIGAIVAAPFTSGASLAGLGSGTAMAPVEDATTRDRSGPRMTGPPNPNSASEIFSHWTG